MTLAMETNEAVIPPQAGRVIERALIPLFAVTLLTSAGLLFWIQPLFAKMALPLLGGAPAVWNTAMMFFQATLLLGYAYVHFVSLKLPPKGQVFLHLFIVAIALYCLPVAVREGYDPGDSPVMSLIILFSLSIGLPFFAISATAPLLQRWFAASGHRHAEDPYFLYGASNLGSILALMAFPLVLEPTLDLRQQGIAWSAGVTILLILIGLCALVPTRKLASARPAPATQSIEGTRVWQQRVFWVALAFAPSSLLLGVTQHISTDVAAVGSTVCYSAPGDRWSLFELDPMIVEIARNENYFTFLRDCDKAQSTRYLVGDARLKLKDVPSSGFNLMVLDAYSSDAVPLHLLTREALALYRTKLTPDGILMFHVSNRYLDLDHVLSALVKDAGMSALILRHKPDDNAPRHVTASHWIAVADRAALLSGLKGLGKWETLPEAGLRPWTDAYSNIFDVLR